MINKTQKENYELYNDDCLNIMPKLKDKSINCIICDLPYYKVSKEKYDNQWGNEESYIVWVEKLCLEWKRLLKDDGSLFIFTSRQMARKIGVILDKYFIEQRIIIWKRKRAFNNTRGKTLSSGYEPISWYTNSDKFTFNNIKEKVNSNRKEYTEGYLSDGVCMSDVWDIPALPHNSKEKVGHDTQKPLQLIKRIVEQFTNEGDIILDNCMGSGTTIISALQLNRKSIGIEKEEKYFKLAVERIRKEYNQNQTL